MSRKSTLTNMLCVLFIIFRFIMVCYSYIFMFTGTLLFYVNIIIKTEIKKKRVKSKEIEIRL